MTVNEQYPITDWYHSVALTTEELYVLEEALDHVLSETEVQHNYFYKTSVSEEAARSQGYELSEAAALLRQLRQKKQDLKNIKHEVVLLLSDVNDS